MADEAVNSSILIQGGKEPSVPTDVQGWKLKIAASWRTAAEGILQVSKDLIDAREALKRIDRRLWIELSDSLDSDRIISHAVQKKLTVIGEKYGDLIQHAASLPPRYNAIYQLTDLSKSKLDDLVRTKRLTPILEDREIAALLITESGPNREKSVPENPKIALLRLIKIDTELSAETMKALRQIVTRLQKLPGLEVKLTDDGRQLLEPSESP